VGIILIPAKLQIKSKKSSRVNRERKSVKPSQLSAVLYRP